MSNRRITAILVLLAAMVSLFPAAGNADPLEGRIAEQTEAMLGRLGRILDQVRDVVSDIADTFIGFVTSEGATLTNNG